MDIGQPVRSLASTSPDLVAIRAEEGSRTYGELVERIDRVGHVLRALGLVTGDRVAVLMKNRLEYPEIDLGIATSGFVRVALNSRLQTHDFVYMVGDADAKVLVTEEDFDVEAEEIVRQVGVTWVRLGEGDLPPGAMDYETLVASTPFAPPDERPSPDDLAWISYTSGTTGRPKGVMLTHGSLTQVADNLERCFGPFEPGAGIILPQPLSHGAGYFVLPYLRAGGLVRIVEGFEPALIEQIVVDEGVTTLKCVPAMLDMLVRHGRKLALTSIIYGAAPMPVPQLEAALSLFGPVLSQIYGQSEAPVTITVLGPADHERPGAHRGSAGHGWPGVDVQVLGAEGQPVAPGEIGEVTVRSSHQMDGYWGKPELTAEVVRDGRIWTRDMATVDDEGFIYLRGRRDDMINSGGFNIAPREVEEVLTSHPTVDEAVVVGVEDERWGQVVKAFLVARPGQAITVDEILEFAKPLLGFRRPRHLEVLESMPRNSYGKVDMAVLRGLAPTVVATGEGAS